MMHSMGRKGSEVKHIAVWAYDREPGLFGATGRHVPLCGQQRTGNRWVFPTKQDDARPYCARCKAAAEWIAFMVAENG